MASERSRHRHCVHVRPWRQRGRFGPRVQHPAPPSLKGYSKPQGFPAIPDLSILFSLQTCPSRGDAPWWPWGGRCVAHPQALTWLVRRSASHGSGSVRGGAARPHYSGAHRDPDRDGGAALLVSRCRPFDQRRRCGQQAWTMDEIMINARPRTNTRAPQPAVAAPTPTFARTRRPCSSPQGAP